MDNPETYIEGGKLLVNKEGFASAGEALQELGRWIQCYYPQPQNPGSQFEEDVILQRLLPHPCGIYVDIGASHSQECSNTWNFYKRGWHGLLIEPLMECWQSLLIDRPRDRLCPLAASNGTGYATLRLARSVSSLEKRWPIEEMGRIPVMTDTLKSILKRWPGPWEHTELCSIDVEGHERDVLAGFDWNTFRPKVIVIEYRKYDAEKLGFDTTRQWERIITSQGYSLYYTTPLNKIWVRK